VTDRIALGIAAAVAALLAADWLLMDGANSLFLARRLTDLVEWVAFWR
jgi:hypothetical protein